MEHNKKPSKEELKNIIAKRNKLVKDNKIIKK